MQEKKNRHDQLCQERHDKNIDEKQQQQRTVITSIQSIFVAVFPKMNTNILFMMMERIDHSNEQLKLSNVTLQTASRKTIVD